MNTKNAATGKWHGILRHFGLEESFLRNVHGPCPMCGGTDRYRFDDKDGSGSYFCSGCGAGSGFDLAIGISGKDFKAVAAEVDAIVGNIKPERITRPEDNGRIQQVLKKAVPARQSPEVMAYLRGRGLQCSNQLLAVPEMRYYEEGNHKGTFAAMLGRFLSASGQLSTIHATYLQGGAKAPVKASKKLLTPICEMAGGAIRLTKIYRHIGIAEGIETALAVMRDFKAPCWAAGNAVMLERFAPPEGVEFVTVYSDNDANYTGQKSAYILAHRLSMEGYKVKVIIPKKIGDFADSIVFNHNGG